MAQNRSHGSCSPLGSTSSYRRKPSHRILLPRSFLFFLDQLGEAALILGGVPESNAEDLESTFPKFTVRGGNIEQLLQSRKFFARLDTCSLKDAIIGENDLKSSKDIWTRLATSGRGMTGIRHMREEDGGRDIYLYLFPWNERIQTKYEYRVFCCPPNGDMVAMSQYQWHKPWFHAEASTTRQHDIAERLVSNCKALHEKLLAHEATTEEIKARGFVFDVVEDPETQEVMLLELNDFGAMCMCGSCLFQWVRDARVLYGLEREKGVEVRVTL